LLKDNIMATETEYNSVKDDIISRYRSLSEEEKDIIRSNKGTEFANVLKKLFGDNILRGIVLSNPKETIFRKGGLATR
tara:strand:- start:57 stop:290 length:234 start_codon:yes stop_codon:yes gene_type:complete